MNLYVVDASVVAKWFLNEPHAEAAFRLLDVRYHLHAPDFFLIEVDNVLCKKIRRGEMTKAEGRRVREAVRVMPIRTHPFAPLLDPAFALANRTRRSLYDCLHLALTLLLNGQLVTADRPFYDALRTDPLTTPLCWVEDVP